MYGLDSLRQLTAKFLEKEELANFQFQAEFLQPFEDIMTKSGGVSRSVREHVVNITAWMVENKKKSIKSGWKTVFHILRAAAMDDHQEAFVIMERILSEDYDILVENFTDGIQALLAFGQSKSNTTTSMKAIGHLLSAAEKLAAKTREEPGAMAPPAPDKLNPQATDASRHPAEQWLTILRGLSSLVSDLRREVRAEAMSGLFDCFQKHGDSSFDEDTWRMVFNGVIKPLFDDIHHQMQDQRKDGGPEHGRPEGVLAPLAALGPPTCLQALTALVRLFEAHLDSLAFLLDDVLEIIRSCIG